MIMISQCTALVPYVGPLACTEKDQPQSDEAQRLLAKVTELEGRIDFADKGIDLMLEDVEEDEVFRELYGKFTALVSQIQAEQALGLDPQAPPQHMRDPEPGDSYEKNDSHMEAKDKGRKKTRKKSRLKSLYRTLAQLLHPDRSKIPNCEELFVKALEAYTNNDLIALTKILEYVRQYNSNIKYSTLTEEEILGALRSKVNDLQATLAGIESSLLYNLFCMWHNVPRPFAIFNINNYLRRAYAVVNKNRSVPRV